MKNKEDIWYFEFTPYSCPDNYIYTAFNKNKLETYIYKIEKTGKFELAQKYKSDREECENEKSDLISLLKYTAQCLEENDSFEGRLRYQLKSKNEFNIDCAIRHGNSQGQGSVRFIADKFDE